jgi:hypothetical protein
VLKNAEAKLGRRHNEEDVITVDIADSMHIVGGMWK